MIPLICWSLKVSPKAGMRPSLPYLMRAVMKASLRFVPASTGPLPAERPPSSWQNPQVEAKSPSASSSVIFLFVAAPLIDPLNSSAAQAAATMGKAARARVLDIAVSPRCKGGASGPHPPTLLAGLFQRVDCKHARVVRHRLKRLAEHLGEAVGDHAAPAGDDGDILLAAGHVSHGPALMTGGAVAMRPQLL